MTRHSTERLLRIFAVLTALLVSFGAVAQTSRPQWGETLLLALKINGVPQDAMLRAVRLTEGLAIPQSVWDDLHLRLPTGKPRVIDGEVHVLLATNGPVHWRIDEATQTLEIEAAPAAFLGQHLDLTPGAPRVTQPSAWAPYVNYDIEWDRQTGTAPSTEMQWETGLFSPLGNFSNTGLARSSASDVRLETYWQHDFPERLARLTVGDSINQAGAWGRAVRFGGVQWGTDFSLQPGFLSFPLPTLHGEAALPSTLDVYVNNSQRLQSNLQSGPFDLSELPVVTGQGEIRTVVRDLLGREQVVVTPYYVSPALLKPGLNSYSFELGSERDDYGIASNHYGPAMLTATDRRGITDNFTAELRGELSDGQQVVGGSGWMLWPALGTANLSAVGSHESDVGSGWMLVAGLDRQARDWSGSLQIHRSSPNFSQLGQPQATAAHLVITAALGTSWQGQSLGASYTQQSGGPTITKLAQINYGRDLGSYWGYVGVVAFRDFSPSGGGTTIGVTWSHALDAQHSASLSLQHQPNAGAASQNQLQAQVQRNAGMGSDYGYQLLVENSGHQIAQVTWQGEHAVLTGGVAQRGGDVETRAGATGGVALLDGSIFTGRHIDDGIALVDVGGYSDVRVLQDNQIVAHTDAQGRAFITGLRGYQSNRVGIDSADLPMDAELEALEMRLTPAARSASYIEFPVQRGHAASLHLLDAAGHPVPPGTQLRAANQKKSFPVGLEGRAYVAGLVEGHNRVTADWNGGHCEFEFDLPPLHDRDDLPDLGTLTCR